MRFKIIAANAVIVLIVGVVAFFLVRMTLAASGTKADQLAVEARQDVQGAAARLQLDAISAEQWLTVKAGEPETIDALMKGGAAAADAATARCTQIQTESKNIDVFRANVPTFVALVDMQGKIVGRNSTNAQRGDDLGKTYPALKTTLTNGQPGADVWIENQDRYLASYVAVRDATGKIAGALVIGRTLSDALSRVSDLTTGRALAVVVQNGDKLSIAAESAKTDSATDAAIARGDGPVPQSIRKTLKDGHGSDVVVDGDLIVAASALDALASGARAVLVAPGAAAPSEPNVVVPVFGAVLIGIAMVILAGWLLGNYITRPIATLEEGLLAILNGQADKRFELDHAELGGLAFRIDQLLNQLMGVEEDTTDAEGRPSQAPSAAHFSDAMSVEDKKEEAGLDAAALASLAAEPSAQYYARIYREYIAAKKALGEPTEHITEQAFVSRIQGMEKEASDKYAKPVRYQVQARNKEVVLLAIPLP